MDKTKRKKIVLTSEEVNQILVDYLASQGKIECEMAFVTWHLDHYHVRKPVIVIEQ